MLPYGVLLAGSVVTGADTGTGADGTLDGAPFTASLVKRGGLSKQCGFHALPGGVSGSASPILSAALVFGGDKPSTPCTVATLTAASYGCT